MELTILHLYPEFMSLYGEYANLAVLRRHLEALGVTVSLRAAAAGEAPDFAGADMIYMGAGTERSARAAMPDFARYREALKAAAQDCAPMLFAGTAMDLIGKSVKEADGSSYEGLGLASFTTEHGKRRIVGDVYGHTGLYPEAVVGFMNKCGVVTGVETPLLASVEFGIGNEGEKTPEGFHWKNVFASQLTGPLLVKNPKLLETVAAALCARRGKRLPVGRRLDRWAEQAYAVTEEQLRLRAQAK